MSGQDNEFGTSSSVKCQTPWLLSLRCVSFTDEWWRLSQQHIRSAHSKHTDVL